MAKTSTVTELLNFLKEVEAQGYGDCEVLFDTEARKFDYHMAKIDRAYFEKLKEHGLTDAVHLHEERK